MKLRQIHFFNVPIIFGNLNWYQLIRTPLGCWQKLPVCVLVSSGAEGCGYRGPAGWQHCATLIAAALSSSSASYSNCDLLRPVHSASPEYPLRATMWRRYQLVSCSRFTTSGSTTLRYFASLGWRNRLSAVWTRAERVWTLLPFWKRLETGPLCYSPQ